MHVTIVLPITMSPEDAIVVADLQRQQGSVKRSAFKLAKTGMKEKEMRVKLKSMNNIPDIDTWFQQCAIRSGMASAKADKELEVEGRVFGKNINLRLRSEGKLSKEEWKAARLMPFYVEGEACKSGNRKFTFDVFASNTIIFKKCQGTKIPLHLPKLRKNLREKLVSLECAMNEDMLPVTFSLTTTHIHISYDDARISKTEKVKVKAGRVMGVDLNPNWIGCSIQNTKGEILETRMYDLSILTRKSGHPSNHKKSKHKNNKLDFETTHAAIDLVKLCVSRHVGTIVLERLKFAQGAGGKPAWVNRLNNNVWKRGLWTEVVKKYAERAGIEVKLVSPAYTSTIGNVLNRSYPDPVASSIEIGRRGLHLGYPPIISHANLEHLWKEAKDWEYETWIDLHEIFKKNPKMKYRVPILKSEMAFRNMRSYKSNVSYS